MALEDRTRDKHYPRTASGLPFASEPGTTGGSLLGIPAYLGPSEKKEGGKKKKERKKTLSEMIFSSDDPDKDKPTKDKKKDKEGQSAPVFPTQDPLPHPVQPSQSSHHMAPPSSHHMAPSSPHHLAPPSHHMAPSSPHHMAPPSPHHMAPSAHHLAPPSHHLAPPESTETLLPALSTTFSPSPDAGKDLEELSHKSDIEADYEIGKMLGQGAFAVVYMGVQKETGEKVAIKKIRKNAVKENEMKNLRLEVKIMTNLDHPGIIKLIDVYEEDESLYIITELAEGGELLNRLSKRKTFNEEDARGLVRNILEAIKYLHSLKIAHRDLKPENLLLKSSDDDTDVRLADFGISRFYDQPMKTVCGTPAYTAPEVLESSNYSMAVDLWSVGIIAYLLLSGKTPFQAASLPRMYMKIMEGEFDFPEEDWGNVSDSAKHFIQQLLQKNPLKRMPAAEALKHRWLSDKESLRTSKNLATLSSLRTMQHSLLQESLDRSQFG